MNRTATDGSGHQERGRDEARGHGWRRPPGPGRDEALGHGRMNRVATDGRCLGSARGDVVAEGLDGLRSLAREGDHGAGAGVEADGVGQGADGLGPAFANEDRLAIG